MSHTRITIPLSEEMIVRLRTLTESLGVSQAKLVSCLLHLDDEQITEIVKANLSKVKRNKNEEKAAARRAVTEARAKAREALKSMSKEQLDALLAGVQND